MTGWGLANKKGGKGTHAESPKVLVFELKRSAEDTGAKGYDIETTEPHRRNEGKR